MLDPDLWLRRQLWQLLWNGPGAVSAYLSIPIPLAGAGLSPFISTGFQGPSFCILAINVLLSVFLILIDLIGSCRKHHRGLLRFSVTGRHKLHPSGEYSYRRRPPSACS
jgi:hypothetical protein